MFGGTQGWAFMSSRAKQVCRVMLLCALMCGAVSCARRYTLHTPADMVLLPASRGINGGSFVALTDWQYQGSDSGFHYFWHYYNIGNSLRRSSVRIPRSGAPLDFPQHAVEKAGEWVTLLGKHPETFQFVLYHAPPALLTSEGRTNGLSQ
jgi:hypothetical protein